MLPCMGPRNSSFPVRSLPILCLVAAAALTAGCVSYSRPYGHYGGYGPYGHSSCRSYGGCGYGYAGSYSRYRTVYVPVYRDTHRHRDDAQWRHRQPERGWDDDRHRDRDRDHHRSRDRDRNRNDDRRVGPPPQPQPQPQARPPQRQRMAEPRAEAPRTRGESRPRTLEDWRADRARRSQPATANPGRSGWREARERP